MTIWVDWGPKIIHVEKADMTLIDAGPPEIYELDLDALRLALRELEAGETGIAHQHTHRHNTQVILSGVTYARVFEIINGYTLTFEPGQYAVNAIGANSNIADVMNVNQVSLRTANSAGLVVVTGTEQPASAFVNFAYDEAAQTLRADAWLERNGQQVVANLVEAEVRLYDPDGVLIETKISSSPRSYGVFPVVFEALALSSNRSYNAIVTVEDVGGRVTTTQAVTTVG